MKELHEAIILTDKMLQQALEMDCVSYEAILRIHRNNLIELMRSALENEMEGFTSSPVSYDLPRETVETLTVGENTQSQLPQDNAEAFAAAVDYADGWRPVRSDNLPDENQRVEIKRESGKRQFSVAKAFYWGWLSDGEKIIAWRPA